MGVRKLLYLDIRQHGDTRLVEQLLPEWELLTASDAATTHFLLNENNFRVGLVSIDSNSLKSCAGELQDILLTHSRIKWIALLPPSALQCQHMCTLLADHFYDFHHHPLDARRLNTILGHAFGNAQLNHETSHRQTANCGSLNAAMVGNSGVIQALRRQLGKVAKVDAPVLITGDTGTGKDLAANFIHCASARAARPFVAFNCAALPPDLVQAELFGYEKGAFTGAYKQKIGRIESANTGTVFLDEIGDLPAVTQITLLRFLEDHTIDRLGGVELVPVNVRIIAATNVDLRHAVERGKFRQDLYYRLRVLHVHLPTLAERGEDVEHLAAHFFEKFRQEKQPAIRGFSKSATLALHAYDWPGNVRELMNNVRRALVMSDGPLILPADLGLEQWNGKRILQSLDASRAAAEKAAITFAIERSGHNITHAAKSLDVSRGTLYRLMEKFDIQWTAHFPEDKKEIQNIQ